MSHAAGSFKSKRLKSLVFLVTILICVFAAMNIHATRVYAIDTSVPLPQISIDIGGNADTPTEVTSSLQLLLLIALITIAPFALLMVTCFTRILITLSFIRAALGTQQMPPNQILIGIALFLTLFIMAPTFDKMNEQALAPYTNGEITQQEAIDRGLEPLKEFMLSQTSEKDVTLFASMAPVPVVVAKISDLPLTIIIPAFILGEITKGFIVGFIIYIPFIVIDMVVASVLMAMGMMMLPPAMISLPFKLLLFIMIDGWNLILKVLVQSFY